MPGMLTDIDAPTRQLDHSGYVTIFLFSKLKTTETLFTVIQNKKQRFLWVCQNPILIRGMPGQDFTVPGIKKNIFGKTISGIGPDTGI